jgi:putative mRNA 3-end processing factor
LIPAFSVGRAQEILIVLAKADLGVTIYLDGMAKKVTDLCLKHSKFIRDAKVLKNALQQVVYVKDRNQRSRIVKEQAIIVTTAGMMDGGPVMDYVKYYYHDGKNAILLTGYQGEGTNGRTLLEKGILNVDGQNMKVKAYYEKFDFSAHSGQAQLIELITSINPKVLLLNHGDPEEIEQLASKLSSIKKVLMPKDGEIIRV